MPAGDRMLALTLTALVLVAIPGPSVLFVVSRSVMLGRRAGLATVVGNAAGVFALCSRSLSRSRSELARSSSARRRSST
jgi:threonine/homoserine/homoserine lactone efflux protein